ncbi:hypothetical protein J0K78_15070 [Halobacillus sp. GSS1]|uniref:hypothetical protein n=1 Tax=Halobacillus sp. GSS1 TaxID=2815919 RepID=UPI001A8C79EC|nr:hypothetical protein [Halobacillus sp. GSS1]MBN9655604.1 hypothetical protein [Halobacillus sp. GSS1]
MKERGNVHSSTDEHTIQGDVLNVEEGIQSDRKRMVLYMRAFMNKLIKEEIPVQGSPFSVL